MFVGGFLGDPPMNFFEVSTVRGELAFPNGSTLKLGSRENDSKNVIVGVRPDWITIQKASQKKPHISGEIKIIEFQGDQNILTVASELGTFKIITDTDNEFSNGSNIGLNLDAKKLSLFDTQSKKAMKL